MVVGIGRKRSGLILDEHLGKILLPGDEFVKPPEEKMTVGPGLKVLPRNGASRPEDIIVVCQAGILSKKNPSIYLMEVKLKNYSAYRKDDLVGIIKQKKGDQFIVDIGTRDRVTLSKYAFEGATKKYRPDHKIGDLMFGKLVALPQDFPLEMTCVNAAGKSVGQGLLSEGFLIRVPHHMVRILRNSTKGNLVEKIGRITPVEIVAGVNGYVWIKSKRILTTILISQVLQAISFLPPENHNKIIRTFRDSVSGWV